MLGIVLICIVCATLVKSEEEKIIIFDNKTMCMNDMIEWCDNMQYPQQGAGMAVLSVVYEDPNGYYRVFCSSDSEGTNCTRNTSPWFTCSSDHVLTYKEQIISNETLSQDVDDDICATADKAFNELFVQNLSYNNITLKNEVQKGMEEFFDQMAIMEEQINLIKRFLGSLPYIGDLWNVIDEDYGEKEYDMPATPMSDKKLISENQANQIETE